MSESSSRTAVLVLALGALALYLGGLGGLGLWAPDEPRYAQVASEVASGEHGWRGLLVLHLNGEPYTQKPPFYYWLAALASLPGGGAMGEVAARLPSALAGLVTVWLTWRLGVLLAGARVGLWGAALLLCTFEFTRVARRVQLDVLLSALVGGALLAWVRLERGIGSQARNVALLHGCMGLGVLTKGPVGLLPLLVIAAYLVWERRLSELRRAVPAWGLALSLGPGLLWIASAVALTPEGFFGEAVLDNVFARFFEGTSKVEPFYYFAYQLPLTFLPTTLLLPLAGVVLWRRHRSAGVDDETRRSDRFLLAWIGAYLVFFSLSAGKRGLYVLPAFPALSLLCAGALVATLDRAGTLSRRVERWLLGVLAFGAVLGAAFAAVAASGLLPDEGIDWPIGFAVAVAAICTAVAWGMRRLRLHDAGGERRLALFAAGLASIQLLVFLLLFPVIDVRKSPRPIARAAASLAGPGHPIGLFRHSAMTGGLAFYSGRRIVELDDAEEVRAFFAAGGRAVAVRDRYLDRFAEEVPVEVQAEFRAGRRSYVVVTPASAEAPAAISREP